MHFFLNWDGKALMVVRNLSAVRGVGFEPTNLYRIGASGLRL